MKKLTLPLSLEQLIQKLEQKRKFQAVEIQSLVREAGVTADDLLEWADFNHVKKEGYGRQLIHQSDYFEVMCMSWAPNDATAIHNHGNTMWGAVQVFGDLEHSVFELEDDHLFIELKEKLSYAEVIPVSHELIHQMTNTSSENILSLHVYGSPFNTKGTEETSLIFDIGKGEIQQVKGGVFFDLPKIEVEVLTDALFADRLTEIHHYNALLRHYVKTGVKGPQYRKAVNYFLNRSFERNFSTELEMDSKGVLYMIELNKSKELLSQLNESTRTVDSIIADINNFERYS